MIQTKTIKKDNLSEMESKLNITIDGIENYPYDDEPTLVIANHSCLMDIFYLAMAVPEPHVSVISSRVLYKNEYPRKDIVNSSLYAMPLEPMGGIHSKIAMKAMSEILGEGVSLSIFPEGIYNNRKLISRGRTGVARILAGAVSKGVLPHYVPVAIDVRSNNRDLNSIVPSEEDEIHIQILEPQNYERLMWLFYRAQDFDERNALLHQMVDLGMQEIADALDVDFSGQYINVSPKENVMYQDGSVLSFEEAKLEENIEKYRDEVMTRARHLVKKLRR